MYFFLTIEAPEDGGLIAFGNALAGVGYFDFHIHFPQHHRHSDFPACRGVLHRIVQQVKKGFGCPLAVMENGQILRAVHGHDDFLFLCCIHNSTHGLCHGITDTVIFPPAGVYFTALSNRLKRASDVHLLSWEKVKFSGQSTDTAIFFFSAAYTIPLMACATVSKRQTGFLFNWITPVSSREVFTRA